MAAKKTKASKAARKTTSAKAKTPAKRASTKKAKPLAKKPAPRKAKPLAKKAAPRKAKPLAKKPAPRKAKPLAKKAAPRKAKPLAKKAAPRKARPLAKKPAPRKAAPAKAPAAPVRRRDGTGHLDPKYAKMLRDKSQEGRVTDDDRAFVGKKRSKDDLAEELGESWVSTATSGEDESQDVYNQKVPEDDGGPFVPSTGGKEFAEGTDPSNPPDAQREPFPRS